MQATAGFYTFADLLVLWYNDLIHTYLSRYSHSEASGTNAE
jgi:hypothetical protein